MSGIDALAEDCDIAGSALHRDCGIEPRDHFKEMAVRFCQHLLTNSRDRLPDVGLTTQAAEAGGQHTNNGPGFSIDDERAADSARRCVEPAVPQSFADEY